MIKKSDLVWTSTSRQTNDSSGTPYVVTFQVAPLGDCAEIRRYPDGIVLSTDAGSWGFHSVKAALAYYNLGR